jgi:hypothetical protein
LCQTAKTLDEEESSEGTGSDGAVGEPGGAALVDGNDDLPDTFDAPETIELDEDQDAYGIAAE